MEVEEPLFGRKLEAIVPPFPKIQILREMVPKKIKKMELEHPDFEAEEGLKMAPESAKLVLGIPRWPSDGPQMVEDSPKLAPLAVEP